MAEIITKERGREPVTRTIEIDIPEDVYKRPAGLSLDHAMIAWLRAGNPNINVLGMRQNPTTGFVVVSTMEIT